MSLLEDVKKICHRLAPHGWRDLLLEQDLDITAENLEKEFLKNLSNINRDIIGFEDFSSEGKRGIEPQDPARSLLYHALASPNVTKGKDKQDLKSFPTLAEIEIVENYVYGIRPPSIQDLRARAREIVSISKNARNDGEPFIAIVTFASEYRPASQTIHQKHADKCFSRSGISRVGTKEPQYKNKLRGFIPSNENAIHDFNVLPAKYSAYISIQLYQDKELFGPMRSSILEGDEKNKFWIPLHKLFNGKECIKGYDLNVSYKSYHVNEKINRVYQYFRNNQTDYPIISNDLLNKYPYTITEGIADISTNPEYGEGVLIPIVHDRLVEPAEYQGQKVTFLVPSESEFFGSSLRLDKAAPEYVHVRHKIKNNSLINLNDSKTLLEDIKNGDYNAQFYVDFTGDGWIQADCPELFHEFRRNIPAYSLVTAPDFFHNVDQAELMEWYLISFPRGLQNGYWVTYVRDSETNELTLSDTLLKPLSDNRVPANLELNRFKKDESDIFRAEDNTITSIVSLPREQPIEQRTFVDHEVERNSFLPDCASGYFAPGWDIGLDQSEVVREDGRSTSVDHLASYKLGSPFPEDSKLCSALSAFWPAVAPDAARSFWSPRPSVSPLTDTEIGSKGDLSWDGSTGPKFLDESTNIVEYQKIEYVDYVENALANKFSLYNTIKVQLPHYKARINAIASVYYALNLFTEDPADDNKNSEAYEKQSNHPVLSFYQVSSTDLELEKAQKVTGIQLTGEIFRIIIGSNYEIHKNLNKTIQIKFKDKNVCYVGNKKGVLIKHNNDNWIFKPTI